MLPRIRDPTRECKRPAALGSFVLVLPAALLTKLTYYQYVRAPT
jgi:hypothetical protein